MPASTHPSPRRAVGPFGAGRVILALAATASSCMLASCDDASPRPAGATGGTAAARLIQNFEAKAKSSPAAQTFEIPPGGDTWIIASSKALTLQSMPALKLQLNSSEATRLRHENAMVDSAMIARVNETGIAEIQHFLIPVKTEPPILTMQTGEMLIIRRDETGTWIISR